MNDERPMATATVQEDNERVIVTEWCFAPGAQTGWHRHEHDYVVVPLTAGRLLLESESGTASSELTPGVSYFRTAGAEHNVVNDGDAELAFVEVELKGTTAGGG
ncbi:cupin domain-containing protein [Arhodomonas aquaeolei]|uniref:cupin domain-containing protein n=1 Tax=Arhodomonas aquaeolei TaxID=2369 RepID=UPI0003651ED3|nr:cupin domain-containing protein [Arhodomonas aquaeolei]